MPEVFTGRATGYLIEQEDHASILSRAQSTKQFTFGDINPVNLGKPMGFIDITNIEDQMQESSCAGHALTTIAESLVYMASGGKVNVQLCRNFAYVNGQRYSGIVGDNGAVLDGCLKGGSNDGIPLEEFWRYTGQYDPNIPEIAKRNASAFKIKSWAPIRELQEIYECLARRVGGIFMGIPCTQEIFDSPADGRLEQYFPARAGGHALPIIDWCEEKDENGYPYLLMPNSWGKRYGFRGFRKLRPSAVVSMMRCQLSSFYMISDMEFLKPRYDWSSNKWLA